MKPNDKIHLFKTPPPNTNNQRKSNNNNNNNNNNNTSNESNLNSAGSGCKKCSTSTTAPPSQGKRMKKKLRRRPSNGEPPPLIDAARYEKNFKNFGLILKNLFVKINYQFILIRKGDPVKLKKLLDTKKYDVNTTYFGSTALHWAAHEGNTECIELLLTQENVIIDSFCKDNRTPLAIASRKGHVGCLELLAKAGADVNLKTQWGESALSKAVSNNNYSCLETLIKFGAQIESQNTWQETPLWTACDKGFTLCAQKLIQCNTNVNTQNQLGHSALHRAVAGRHRECVELLVANGAKIPDTLINQISQDNDITEILVAAKTKQTLHYLENTKEYPLLKDWTVSHVAEWITLIGHPQYASHFEQHAITGEKLLSGKVMNMENLKDILGIIPYGTRFSLVERFERLLKLVSETGFTSVSVSNTKIDFSELEFAPNNNTLGKGYFGEVKRARWNGTDVAVKFIYRNTNKSTHTDFSSEISLLSRLRHPNIIQYLAISHPPNNNNNNNTSNNLSPLHPCIIMEYMPMGSLHTLISDTPWLLNHSSLVSILLSITRGMIYLHSHKPYPILHRDLSSRNILIAGSSSELTVKIADFGLSEESVPQGEAGKTGQVWIKPPEVIQGERWTEKGDVWSFGCVLWECATRKEVWKDVEELEGIEGEEKGRKWEEMIKSGFKREIKGETGKEWKEVLSSCWQYDKEERKDFKELLTIFEKISNGNNFSVSHNIYSKPQSIQ